MAESNIGQLVVQQRSELEMRLAHLRPVEKWTSFFLVGAPPSRGDVI